MSSRRHISDAPVDEEPRRVYVWLHGDGWRYVEAQSLAPPEAEKAKLFRHEKEDIIWINRGQSGEFVRGAVKVDG